MSFFTLFYFKNYKVRHDGYMYIFINKSILIITNTNLQRAKEMLSAAELNLFMNGDPKSIDYSSSFLQDQVGWSPELPPEPQSHSRL